MNSNEKTLWTVKGKRRYIYLCSKGIFPKEIEPNISCPKHYVWKYEQTKEFFDALKNYEIENAAYVKQHDN